jgi:hypothetical protein
MGAFSFVFLRVLLSSRAFGRRKLMKIGFSTFVVQRWFLALAAALLELVNHAFQIRIAGAKASGKPVPAALHHCLTIGQHFKLAGLALRNHGINAQPLFNHGRETRGLGFVALSRGAGPYLNFHSVLQVVAGGFS